MQNLRQPQKLDKGDRQISGRSVVFRPEGVYIYIERAKTAVEKDHKFKEIRRISTLNCLIYGFFRVLRRFLFFSVFFGLTKCDIPNLNLKFIKRQPYPKR